MKKKKDCFDTFLPEVRKAPRNDVIAIPIAIGMRHESVTTLV